jgi:hypothetical protein
LPLANASGFFPFTVAGIGARETAFVALYGLVGVPPAAPLAAAMTISALSYVIGGIGGIIHLVAPVTIRLDGPRDAAAPSHPCPPEHEAGKHSGR